MNSILNIGFSFGMFLMVAGLSSILGVNAFGSIVIGLCASVFGFALMTLWDARKGM